MLKSELGWLKEGPYAGGSLSLALRRTCRPVRSVSVPAGFSNSRFNCLKFGEKFDIIAGLEGVAEQSSVRYWRCQFEQEAEEGFA